MTTTQTQIDAAVANALSKERRSWRLQLVGVALVTLLIQSALNGRAPSGGAEFAESGTEGLVSHSRRLMGKSESITPIVIVPPLLCTFPATWFCQVFSYNATTKTLTIRRNVEVKGTSYLTKPVIIADKATIANSLYVGNGGPFGASILTPGKLSLLGQNPGEGGFIDSQAPDFPNGPTVGKLILGASQLWLDTNGNGIADKKVA